MYLTLFPRVQLTRAPGQSLGISIMGGRGMGRRLSSGEMMRGVFIKHISPDSPAAQHGTLQIGDRILEVCVCWCVHLSILRVSESLRVAASLKKWRESDWWAPGAQEIKWSSSDRKVCNSIPDLCRLCVQLSLGKTPNAK